MLLFYFAGGINLFMAVYVMSAGAGTVEPGKLTTNALIFIVFALVNFYVGRKLRIQLTRLTRQLQAPPEPEARREG
jgi:hypothetical protein